MAPRCAEADQPAAALFLRRGEAGGEERESGWKVWGLGRQRILAASFWTSKFRHWNNNVGINFYRRRAPSCYTTRSQPHQEELDFI